LTDEDHAANGSVAGMEFLVEFEVDVPAATNRR
jgi:hypothetical protein